jgi:hypothetical protein
MASNYSLASQVEVEELPRPGILLKTTFSLYRSRFLRWFSITAPTSLVAAIFLILVDQRVLDIFRSFPVREMRNHFGDRRRGCIAFWRVLSELASRLPRFGSHCHGSQWFGSRGQ